MSKNLNSYHKQDLYRSGKAYQRSFMGQGQDTGQNSPESPPQNALQPYQGYSGAMQNGAYNGNQNGNPYGANLPVPIDQPEEQSSSFLDKLPIKDIKAIVEKMGGVDGIMNMATKVNSMMKTFQEMSPMVKLLLASFLKSKTSNPKVRRRRRKKRKSKKLKKRKG